MTKGFVRAAGRRRRSGWRSPAFAVKVARRLRARGWFVREAPCRPDRRIALEARRREDERLMGGRHV